MNARTVSSKVQVSTAITDTRHQLQFSSTSASASGPGNLEPSQLQARATKMTIVLRQMQEQHGELRGYGIND